MPNSNPKPRYSSTPYDTTVLVCLYEKQEQFLRLTPPTSRMSRKRSSARNGSWAATHVFIAIAVDTWWRIYDHNTEKKNQKTV